MSLVRFGYNHFPMTSEKFPSIFNDVIGPVMRGASSSHCAAAVRIGRMARDLMDREIQEVLIEFDPNGSLATTHQSQGSDMGIFGGFLGWEATDDRLANAHHAILEAGIHVEIRIKAYGAVHPNTYRMTLTNSNESHQVVAISTGGGMVEIIEIDGVNISIAGDYYETLIFLDSHESEVLDTLNLMIEVDEINLNTGDGMSLLEIKSQGFLPSRVIDTLNHYDGVTAVKQVFPVLPVLSRKQLKVPFLNCHKMLEYNQGLDLDFWELALHYESARGDISQEQVLGKMADIVRIMRNAIQTGLAGTEYRDRIIGVQSRDFQKQMAGNKLIDGGVLNTMILYTTALMEAKSSMEVIVAAPTAGACGGLPGTCFGAADAMGLSTDDIIKGMLAAGLIGVFIAANATFSAEVGGCQAECGAGSGMAAAALVTLAGGTTDQAIAAASLALQNILGMICDPVANRVEVPCLGKNILAVSNALACANMALAGFDPVIPLDEVIETMYKVGLSLPSELRCTGLGGLSVTKTSKEIERRLGTLAS
jgi:L-serine dehydratase